MTVILMLGLPFLACVMLATILGYIGVHVLKREVIFIDIAVAQIAALGAIGAHLLLHVPGDSPLALLCGILATLVAAFFFAFMHHHKGNRLPIETLIGITYAVATAATLFAIGKSSGGHTHILEMLSGSLLWVTPRQLIGSGSAFGLLGFIFFLLRRPLQQLSDRYAALEKSRHAMGWDFLFYALCGTVITLAVKLAGVVVVFSFLIIPATVSALCAETWGRRFLISGLTGIAAALAGLLFGYCFDFSAGASIALFLVLLLVAVSTFQFVRKPEQP